ncbi:MAG: hypothetical protein OEW15_18990 [Nitrospirota bacterium]|nr:hypothetical protein [Nitrospirota bacterium]
MKRVTAILLLIVFARCAYAQVITDYLITSDMGTYKQITKGGPSGDILAGADHFGEDHQDETYGISYHNKQVRLWVDVQVTQHTNSDSDKWLLHEVEISYRDSNNSRNKLGLLSGAGVKIREIGGNKFIYWGLGGGSYSWISGQKIIEIKYADLQRTKPEPLEVVNAYLQKHPSTIPSTFDFDQAHDIQWIRDEMDRRLWLCDKWFMQLQLRKVEEKRVYQEAVEHMSIFLNYREKYFRIPAVDEKDIIDGYLSTNNGTGIKAKLKEYKDWWTVNKDKAITLQ